MIEDVLTKLVLKTKDELENKMIQYGKEAIDVRRSGSEIIKKFDAISEPL